MTADQFAVSLTYSADALAVTAFYTVESDLATLPTGASLTAGSAVAYGLGASYDRGGGAKVVGGYVANETADTDAFDLGLSVSF